MILSQNKESIASIDVDAQYGFTPSCPEELPVPHGEEIVVELNAQAKFARYRIGSKDAHPQGAIWVANKNAPLLTPLQGENVDVHWPLHCVPGTKGFDLIQGLPHPAHYDFFIWKGIETDMHPYGICYHDLQEKLSTGLIEFLRDKKIKSVIVGGLATEYCVAKSVHQLLEAGFKTIVNLGACRGFDPDNIKNIIEQMRTKGALIIQSAAELENIHV